MESIRVLIADDHPVFRDGLRVLLDSLPDAEVAGEAASGEEAVKLAISVQPDVILMDLQMPVMNGTDAILAIRKDFPDARVIVLTTYGGDAQAVRALKAGASGYVVKRSAAKEVVDAVRAVHSGQRYLSPQVADAVLDDGGDRKTDPLERLSAREREVLQLLAEGRTGAEIAARLALSQKTVETYRARLVEKLGIRDVAGLVKFAIQRGLVSLD